MIAAIVVVPQAFANSKSQGAVNRNGCEESGCPGHSLSSPGNAAKAFEEGNCEPLVGPFTKW